MVAMEYAPYFLHVRTPLGVAIMVRYAPAISAIEIKKDNSL